MLYILKFILIGKINFSDFAALSASITCNVCYTCQVICVCVFVLLLSLIHIQMCIRDRYTTKCKLSHYGIYTCVNQRMASWECTRCVRRTSCKHFNSCCLKSNINSTVPNRKSHLTAQAIRKNVVHRFINAHLCVAGGYTYYMWLPFCAKNSIILLYLYILIILKPIIEKGR